LKPSISIKNLNWHLLTTSITIQLHPMTRTKNNKSNGKKIVTAIKSARPQPKPIPKALLKQAKAVGINLTWGPNDEPKTADMLRDALKFHEIQDEIAETKNRQASEIEDLLDKVGFDCSNLHTYTEFTSRQKGILDGLAKQETERLDKAYTAHKRAPNAEKREEIYNRAMNGPTPAQLAEQAKSYTSNTISDIETYLDLSKGETYADTLSEMVYQLVDRAGRNVSDFQRMTTVLIQYFLDPANAMQLKEQKSLFKGFSIQDFSKQLVALQWFFSELEHDRYVAMLHKEELSSYKDFDFSHYQYLKNLYELQRHVQETEHAKSSELWPDED